MSTSPQASNDQTQAPTDQARAHIVQASAHTDQGSAHIDQAPAHVSQPTSGSKIVLIGAGDVGVAYAYALVNQGLTDHLAIIDVNEQKTWGHVQDLNHAVPWTDHNTRVTVGTYEDCRDAAIVCICAGAAQKPGETRLDLVTKNTAIFRSIVGEVMDHGFDGIFIVATNPVDILSYATWKISGLDSSRVIGSGTVLDTARYRHSLGQFFGVAPSSVHAYVIGEHGDTELPVMSAGSVAGVSLAKRLEKLGEESSQQVADIFDQTREAAYKIINAKGSTSFGIGMGLARITRAILHNQDVVLPVSALVDGQYGQRDLYIGTPAVIARSGVKDVIELDLDELEAGQFAHSAEVLSRVLNDAGVR